jgi:hypothetical protein
VQVGSSVLEDYQVELAKALGVGDQVAANATHDEHHQHRRLLAPGGSETPAGDDVRQIRWKLACLDLLHRGSQGLKPREP